MSTQPDLILLGYGVDDTLQLTLESERVLSRVGKVYSVGLPPNLARYLKSRRVDVEDLSHRFAPGRPYSECYLDVADHLLRRTAEEQPVILLTPGNPLFLNALARFLALQARERQLNLQVLPGVSTFDALISDVGLDVGTFGVQMFDAQRLVARRPQVNPSVPLIVVQLAGFGLDAVAGAAEPPKPERFAPLASYLAQFYPAQHPVTLVNREPGQGPAVASVPLARFDELAQHIASTSSLFVDRLRQARPQSRPQSSQGASR